VKQWTIRELLLIIGILAFGAAYVADRLRSQNLPEDSFELPHDQFVHWAQEIDRNSVRNSSAIPAESRGKWPWPTPGNWWLEFGTTDARADEIVANIRRRTVEHLASTGWQLTGQTSLDRRICYSLRRGDSFYELESNYFTRPIPINQWNQDPHRVRLSLRWIGVGFTKTYGDLHLAAPLLSVETTPRN
jgi:hypothetical protein